MPGNCYGKTGNWLISSWFGGGNKLGKVKIILNAIVIKIRVFTFISLDECKRYREAIHLDPKYSIAMTEVLAEMLSKIMMKPLETLGESIYIFNKSALSKLNYIKNICV